MSTDQNARALEILYKEYARLRGTAEKASHDSYGDFKLLGTAVGFLGWKFLSARLPNPTLALFEGFLATFWVVALILFQNLVKRSEFYSYLRELRQYEAVIRGQLGNAAGDAFRSAERLGDVGSYRKAIGGFRVIFALTAVVIPTVILFKANNAKSCSFDPKSYWWIYALVACTTLLTYGMLKDLVIRPDARPRWLPKRFWRGSEETRADQSHVSADVGSATRSATPDAPPDDVGGSNGDGKSLITLARAKVFSASEIVE
jgi:hypothetical protein